MNVTMKKEDIISTIQDIVIFKSGLYLNNSEIDSSLNKIDNYFTERLSKCDDEDYIRFRPEEIENVINKIRVFIGELDDDCPLPFSRLVKKYPDMQESFANVTSAFGECLKIHMRKYGNEVPLGEEFCRLLSDKSGESILVSCIFLENMTKSLNRSITYTCSLKEWDGIIKLSDLFNSEQLPTTPDSYFDQRYIDYLAANSDSLYGMNWRQFEGLTAEFFRRENFRVELGTGRKDGGVDLTIINPNTNQVIIVQCKRYSETNTVDVNTVKALYFDVIDKPADHALIVTTSRICADGKKIIAKNYPITAFENAEIIEWVKSMSTRDKL